MESNCPQHGVQKWGGMDRREKDRREEQGEKKERNTKESVLEMLSLRTAITL